jgi:hypothetical protein
MIGLMQGTHRNELLAPNVAFCSENTFYLFFVNYLRNPVFLF